MSRRSFVTLGIALLLGAAADSAAPADPPRIGFLTPLAESASLGEFFRQGLRELGYIEGKNINIEWRRADTGQQLQALADELVKEKVDVIVTPTGAANLSQLVATNLTGHPAVILPNGFRDDGTPVSLTFLGGLFEEAKLMAVASAYQKATGFHLVHPAVPLNPVK